MEGYSGLVTGGSWKRTKRRKALIRVLALTAALLLGFLPTGYYRVGPGPVESLKEIVAVEGFGEPRDSIRMVTVVAEEASFYGAVIAAIDRRVELLARDHIFGGLAPEEYQEKNQALMASSIHEAIYLALSERGYAVGEGDELPIQVRITPGEVVGPSAGLAFALEIYLRLSGEEPLGAKPVAATGMVDRSGRVLPVGGIAQKTIACRESGIGLFIVPRANLGEALEHSGDMRVVGVSRFEEALRAVGAAVP